MSFTIELTPKQIEAIFDAGRERGYNEAVAYERGYRAGGKRLDGLRDLCLYDPDHGVVAELEQDERDEWWAAFVATLGST